MTPPPRGRAVRQRTAAALLLVVGLGLGLAVSRMPGAGFAGDALYAVMAVVLARLLLPGRSWRWHTALGWGWCVAVELLQATGIPATIAAAVPAARLVLGTTFVPVDLVAYTVGALGCAAVIVRSSRWSSVPRAWRRPTGQVHPRD